MQVQLVFLIDGVFSRGRNIPGCREWKRIGGAPSIGVSILGRIGTAILGEVKGTGKGGGEFGLCRSKEEFVDHGCGGGGAFGPKTVGFAQEIRPIFLGMWTLEVLQSGELIDVVGVVQVSVLET